MGMDGGEGKRDALGFRRRGESTTRLEAFVDAAFAFALTLVVIAVGSVPSTPEELLLAMKSIPAFAACFWLLSTFWRGHVDWSERFGLDDGPSRSLSLGLIFLVLIFVFPLRIVFSSFFAWISDGALPAEFSFETTADVQRMFQTFAVAFGSMGAVLFGLYVRVWQLRDELGLDERERRALRLVMQSWVLLPVFALASLGLSLWTPSLRYAAPGMIFFLLHVVHATLRWNHGRIRHA